jgi:hypothetical protein
LQLQQQSAGLHISLRTKIFQAGSLQGSVEKNIKKPVDVILGFIKAVSINRTILWVVTQCSLVDMY